MGKIYANKRKILHFQMAGKGLEVIVKDTKMVRIDPANIDGKLIEEAGAVLRNGGLVAFPTETVYGLGADGLLAEGAMRIYEAKGRPSDNPLIIHIAEFDALKKIVKNIPEEAKALADAFWPGPLTMIFEKSDLVPLATTGGLQSVAVRMPSHPVALAMIKAGGGYIAAPSANTSGRPSPTLAEHVAEDLNGRIDMIIDGGPVGIGLESTIIDLSEKTPMVLRPGYITRQMLADVIGSEVIDDPGFAEETNVRPKAPGMKYKHYAPKADLTLVCGEMEHVVAEINRLTKEAGDQGLHTGVICTDETWDRYDADIRKSIGSREDEDSIAAHLYGILRAFDELDVDVIYSESFATPRIGQAIMNRLLKAAGHQVLDVSLEDR